MHYLYCTSVSTMQSVGLFSTEPPTSKRKNLLCKMYSFSKSSEIPQKKGRLQRWECFVLRWWFSVWHTEVSLSLSCCPSFFLCVCSLIKCKVIRLMICGHCEVVERNWGSCHAVDTAHTAAGKWLQAEFVLPLVHLCFFSASIATHCTDVDILSQPRSEWPQLLCSPAFFA